MSALPCVESSRNSLTRAPQIVCNTGYGVQRHEYTNTEFELRGFNHLALVARDMAETVAWYEDILGMKLVKTLELPGGFGQHFFLDMGNGRRRDRLLLTSRTRPRASRASRSRTVRRHRRSAR